MHLVAAVHTSRCTKVVFGLNACGISLPSPPRPFLTCAQSSLGALLSTIFHTTSDICSPHLASHSHKATPQYTLPFRSCCLVHTMPTVGSHIKAAPSAHHLPPPILHISGHPPPVVKTPTCRSPDRNPSCPFVNVEETATCGVWTSSCRRTTPMTTHCTPSTLCDPAIPTPRPLVMCTCPLVSLSRLDTNDLPRRCSPQQQRPSFYQQSNLCRQNEHRHVAQHLSMKIFSTLSKPYNLCEGRL